MILSIDAEKAFDKILHPFTIKTLNKLVKEGKYLNTMNTIYDKPRANILLNSEKNNIFSSKIRRNERKYHCIQYIHHSPFLFNIICGTLCRALRQEEEITTIQIRKEEIKLSLFRNGMIFQVENPQNSTRKLLELIKKSVKLHNTKLTYKNQLHFYILIKII